MNELKLADSAALTETTNRQDTTEFGARSASAALLMHADGARPADRNLGGVRRLTR